MSKPMHPNPSRSEAAGKNICQHRIRSNLASAFVALFRLKERGQGWVWIWNRLQLEKSMRFMGFGRRVHIFGVVFPSKRILPLCVSVLRPTPPDCYLHPPHLIIFTINLQMGACLNHSLLQQRSTQDKDFSEKTKTGHLEQIGIWFLLELFWVWLPFYTHLRLRGCGRETIPGQNVWWIFWAAKQNALSEQFIQFIQHTQEDTGCSIYSTRLNWLVCWGLFARPAVPLVRKLIIVPLYIQCETAGGETAPWIWLHYNTCVCAVLQRARVHGSWDWVIPSGLASIHPVYCKKNNVCNFCVILDVIQNIWAFNYFTKANKLRRYICSVLKWID